MKSQLQRRGQKVLRIKLRKKPVIKMSVDFGKLLSNNVKNGINPSEDTQ